MHRAACREVAYVPGEDDDMLKSFCMFCEVKVKCLSLFGSAPEGVVAGLDVETRCSLGLVPIPIVPKQRCDAWQPELPEETYELLCEDIAREDGEIDWRAHAERLGTKKSTLWDWFRRMAVARAR